jgi:hypothetical protein
MKKLVAQKLMISLLSDKSRMFYMFSNWINDWGYFGESFNLIEQIIDVFMNNQLILYFKNNMIIFFQTIDKDFYILIETFNENEKKLFLEWSKNKQLVPVYTTLISYPKENILNISNNIRINLCNWFIIFDIVKTINYLDHILKIEEVYTEYIKVLKKIKREYKFPFIQNIIFACQKAKQ